ncbi:MAG: hypothetical protein CMM80_03250 [Rhodospirillaceae bacterium]|nr:hypothetical protein [Rhodospirillaceae bacterium]
MAEDENKQELDQEQKLAKKRAARAKLRSRLILGGIFGSVTFAVLGLFGYGILYLSAPAEPTDPELEARLLATSQYKSASDETDEFDEMDEAEFAEDDEGNLLAFNKPVHRYFAFPAPFISNLHNSRKLLTIELALATLQSPLTADGFVEDLREFEPVLRDRILNFLITQEPNKLKTRRDRERLADEIRAQMNDALNIDEQSDNEGITDVYILKLVVA